MPVDPLPDGTLLFVEPHGKGRYRVVSRLSSGGFGITYRAVDTWFENTALAHGIVIKELACEDLVHRVPGSAEIAPNSADTREAHERLSQEFFREARILLRFRNRHVVHVVDTWSENGTAYYAMLDLEGAAQLGRTPISGSASLPLRPWEEVQHLAEQVLDGLDAIHRGKVFHLDIKPENLLLCPDGRVVLIDFGTARRKTQLATAPTRLSGLSLFYAPKEILEPFFAPTVAADGTQVPLPRPHEVGAWTDLYSWALVVYGLVKTHPSPQPWLRCYGAVDPYSNAAGDLRLAGVPDNWAAALQQCLLVDPQERRTRVTSVAKLRALIRGPAPVRTWSLPSWAAALESAPEIVVCPEGNGAFRTIADALAAAPQGARISVRPGTYREAISIDKAVMIEGRSASGEACRDDVIIESSDKPCIRARGDLFLRGISFKNESNVDRVAVIDVRGHLSIESCRLSSDGSASGIQCSENVTMGDCEIEGVRVAITSFGDAAEVRNLRIKRSRVGLVLQQDAIVRESIIETSGILIDGGLGHTEIDACVLSGGVWSEGSGTLAIRRSEVHLMGAIRCSRVLTLDHSTIRFQGGVGAIVVAPRTEGVFRDCVIRGTRDPAIVVHGAAVIERCDVQGSGGIVCKPGGTISASDNVE